MTITNGNKRLQALAAALEAAWKAEVDLPEECGNDRMNDAVDRTKVFVTRILCLRGTDILIHCLKARAFLWAQAANPEKFAEHAHHTTAKALASLFRDLGADNPVGGGGPGRRRRFPVPEAALSRPFFAGARLLSPRVLVGFGWRRGLRVRRWL
jgi:hypothetical protein